MIPDKREIVLLAASFLLFVLVAYAAEDIPLESLADFTVLTGANFWINVFFVAFSSYVLSYVLSRTRREVRVPAALLFTLILILTHPLDSITTLIAISFVLPAALGVREPSNISTVWENVRRIRSAASLVFLVALLLIVLSNPQYYNDVFLEKTLELVNSYTPTQPDVNRLLDALVPLTLTPEENRYITEYLMSLPEWNSLTPEQRSLLYNRMVEAVLQQKKVLREVLASSIGGRTLLDRETLLALLGSDPRLSTLLNYLYFSFVLFGIAVFSLVTEVVSLLVFLFVLFPEHFFVLRFRKKEPCN